MTDVPTEAEIRAYMESYPADSWTLEIADGGYFLKQTSAPFEEFIAGDHVTDDDFGVFCDAERDAFQALVPALTAALRPLMIEAQVRGAVRFFEHYPEAPLAKQPVPA